VRPTSTRRWARWKGRADADAAGQPQLRNAAEFAELIVSQRGGNPVRLKDVARSRTASSRQDLGHLQRRAVDHAGRAAPARRQHRAVVDAVRGGPARAARRSCRSRSADPVNDRSVSVREALHDVTLTLMGTIALVVLVIFLFLRRFVATVIPTLSLPVSLIGAVALLWGLATAWTTSRCWA
jgi:HAE1 family hydrophobic/amphiphilic exporter-1